MTAPLNCKSLFFNLLLTLSFSMGGMSLFSQVRFEKSYPMMNETTGFGVALAPDEGHLSCGSLYSGEVIQGLAICTNAVGDTLWTRLYDNVLYAVCPGPDGGYFFTGWRNSSHEQNLLMMKTDKYGNIEWENSAGSSTSIGRSICLTADSGYCIVGETTPYETAPSQILVARINRNGDPMWTRWFGDGAWSLTGKSIIPDDNAGFVICGTRSTVMGDESDMLLLNIDSAGNEIWMKTYSHSLLSDAGSDVIHTTSGGYFAAGTTRLPDNSDQALWIVRTDSQGDTLWTKTFDTLAWASPGVDATLCATGGFAITGVVYDPVSFTNNILLKRFDADGNILWSRNFGSLGHEYAFGINTASDQGFLVIGSVWDPVFQTMDTYLAKTDDQGHVTPVSTADKEATRNIQIFPDPTPGWVTITSVDPVVKMTVVNYKGVAISELTFRPEGICTQTTDFSHLPDGIYLLKIDTKAGTFLRKVIKD